MYNFLFYEPRYDLSSYKSINLVKYDVLIFRNWEKHSDAFFLMDMNGSLTNIFRYELHWAWIHWPWYPNVDFTSKTLQECNFITRCFD